MQRILLVLLFSTIILIQINMPRTNRRKKPIVVESIESIESITVSTEIPCTEPSLTELSPTPSVNYEYPSPLALSNVHLSISFNQSTSNLVTIATVATASLLVVVLAALSPQLPPTLLEPAKTTADRIT